VPGDWFGGQWLIDKDAQMPNGWAITNHYGKAKFNVNFDANTLVSATHIDDGAWHHIAAVRTTGGPRRLFIDGVLDADSAGPNDDQISNLDPFYIGSDSGLAGFAKATIRDVRIYKTALTASDVESVMNGEP
jgi:hypothetical protein